MIASGLSEKAVHSFNTVTPMEPCFVITSYYRLHNLLLYPRKRTSIGMPTKN